MKNSMRWPQARESGLHQPREHRTRSYGSRDKARLMDPTEADDGHGSAGRQIAFVAIVALCSLLSMCT